MNKIDYNPQMTRYLVKSGIFKDEFFSLVDVGASGGISTQWDSFGDQFEAIGFEPLVSECERLNKAKLRNTKYLPFFINAGDREIDEAALLPHINWYQRSSAESTTKILEMNYQKEKFNSGQPLVYTDDITSLDSYFLKTPKNIDFIKTDTDGWDYQVLNGSKKLLDDPGLLGLFVECMFHGDKHPHSNTFRNIDRFLNEKGFYLFDLSAYRYSKKDLPGKFLYDNPAQTVNGQVSWGDALYLRDYAAQPDLDISPVKILKLACIMEIYGLYDCAVELLKVHKDKLETMDLDLNTCLDLLTKGMGMFSSYKEHITAFKTDMNQFYPKFAKSKTSLIDLLKKMPRLERLIRHQYKKLSKR